MTIIRQTETSTPPCEQLTSVLTHIPRSGLYSGDFISSALFFSRRRQLNNQSKIPVNPTAPEKGTQVALTLKKKSVSFNPTRKVMLIPHNKDYKDADLINTIWHGNDQLTLFKNDAARELQTYMQLTRCSFKIAQHQLYQPKSLSTEELEQIRSTIRTNLTNTYSQGL